MLVSEDLTPKAKTNVHKTMLLFFFFISESEWRLLLISKQTCVGEMTGGHEVFQINKVAVLPLSSTEPVDMELDVRMKPNFPKKSQVINITEDYHWQMNLRILASFAR